MKFHITPNRRLVKLSPQQWEPTGTWAVEVEDEDGKRKLLVPGASTPEDAAEEAKQIIALNLDCAVQIANGVEFD